jgi:hypothetical protein
VCINTLGGYKNSMTVILTGLDIEKKAAIVENTLFEAIGGREQFGRAEVQLVRSDKENPAVNEEAFAYLRFTVFDQNPKKVGRAFSSGIVEMALASIPGFTVTAPPGRETPTVVHWPTLISKTCLEQQVHVGDSQITVQEVIPQGAPSAVEVPAVPAVAVPEGETVRTPLGRLFATRAGDKGGNANLGVWGKNDAAYLFLEGFLTVERLKELLPDVAVYTIERYPLPNLKAVNFVIHGILGEGAAASVRMDPQAKTLGEYLRARVVAIPAALLG